MSITLDLSPELEAQVQQAATQQGMDVQTFIIEAVQRALDPDTALNALLVSLGAEGEATYDEEEEGQED